MRRRGFGHVGVAPAAIGKDVDQLRQDRPTAADAVLLHQDRQDFALLVEISELLAETEKCFARRRSRTQTNAIDVGVVFGLDLETQMRRRDRLEVQPESGRPGFAEQSAPDAGAAGRQIDGIDARPFKGFSNRIPDFVRTLGRAKGTDIGGGLLGNDEIAVGGAFPQHAIRIAAVRYAQAVAGAIENEFSDRMLFARYHCGLGGGLLLQRSGGHRRYAGHQKIPSPDGHIASRPTRTLPM